MLDVGLIDASWGGKYPTDLGKRLQELIEQIQTQPNPAARALLQECLQSLLGDSIAEDYASILLGSSPVR